MASTRSRSRAPRVPIPEPPINISGISDETARLIELGRYLENYLNEIANRSKSSDSGGDFSPIWKKLAASLLIASSGLSLGMVVFILVFVGFLAVFVGFLAYTFHSAGLPYSIVNSSPIARIQPPRPLLHIPPKPIKLTGDDLFRLPDFHEKESVRFRHLRHITENSLIPSKDKAIDLIHRQVDFSIRIHGGLIDQYSAYSSFLYEIARDLERMKDVAEQGPPNATLFAHTGHIGDLAQWMIPWLSKLEVRTPLYSETLLSQYQNFLGTHVHRYEPPPAIREIWSNQLCIEINSTIDSDFKELSNSFLRTRNMKKELLVLDEIQKGLKSPCTAQIEVFDISLKVSNQLSEVLADCEKESRTLRRYMMPWQNYFGATREQKQALYNAKLLEMIALSVERTMERLKELERPV